MASRSRLMLLSVAVALCLSSSMIDAAVDFETCAESEEDMVVGLLQVKTSKVRAGAGFSGLYSPTDGELDATRGALLQLHEIASSDGSVAMGNATSSKGAPVELVAMLELLKGLYNDTKQQITKLSEREQKSKERFEEQKAKHETRLLEVEARFKNHSFSEDFRADE